MNLYALIEPVILSLLLGFGLWMGLRKATPKLARWLGEACRKAGLPQAIANPIFGPPPSRSGACGTCCGCDKPASKAAPISFHRS
jgi:hypothetical protein